MGAGWLWERPLIEEKGVLDARLTNENVGRDLGDSGLFYVQDSYCWTVTPTYVFFM